MAKVALVTGADRGLGLGLTQVLLEQGWTVLAGQHLEWPELAEQVIRHPGTAHLLPLDVGSDSSVSAAAELASAMTDHVDLVICNAAINRSHKNETIRMPQSFDDMVAEYNVNAVGSLRVVQAFLPLLDRGKMKRLCFVSSEAGSIGASTRTAGLVTACLRRR
jgi:NAD(P)-dependent dehydrogenase (short-subunit alcohol dehydrogenase family)